MSTGTWGLNGPIIHEDGGAITYPLEQRNIELMNKSGNIVQARFAVEDAILSGRLARMLGREDLTFKYRQDDKEFTMSVHLRDGNGARDYDTVKDAVKLYCKRHGDPLT